MKKIVFLFILLIFLIPSFVFAQEKIEVNFFFSPTCPHCAEEKNFLDKLEDEFKELEIKRYDFSQNQDSISNFYEKYNVPSEEQGFVPITFIKDRYYLGFSQKIGSDIENYISELTGSALPTDSPAQEDSEDEITTLPLIGEVNLSNYSLPALAVIFGFFDGFNVCSLAALVLILGLVLAFKSKKRVLILGGTFILTTAIIYGLLIFLWHQLFIVLAPYIRKMEIVIGILAIIGAIYFFREFYNYLKYGPVCKMGGITDKLSLKLQDIFKNNRGVLILLGFVLVFAAVITIIEFPCSAVLPVIFAGTLTKAGTPTSLSLIYIAIFLFFYMLDEIIVFLVSVFTLKIWMVSPKFTITLNLIAGILLFILGFYYIFGLVS